MSSDTRARVIARKAERNTKTPEVSRPVAASKDTKRWCRGKVGREHQPKCFPRTHSILGDTGWRELRCEACGKCLAYWVPWFTEPKPEWVTE